MADQLAAMDGSHTAMQPFQLHAPIAARSTLMGAWVKQVAKRSGFPNLSTNASKMLYRVSFCVAGGTSRRRLMKACTGCFAAMQRWLCMSYASHASQQPMRTCMCSAMGPALPRKQGGAAPGRPLRALPACPAPVCRVRRAARDLSPATPPHWRRWGAGWRNQRKAPAPVSSGCGRTARGVARQCPQKRPRPACRKQQ